MATRATHTRRAKSDIAHDGFLRHRNFRWAKISGGLCLVLIVSYLLIDIQPRHNGGSWYGYTLGTIGALLILWLTALGLRKRAMTSGGWSLKAWTSAHVYLGLALTVVGTLHTGFQLGWNVHTLAWVLMMIVILSGLYGITMYARLPRLLSDNREEMTEKQMIEGLGAMDRQIDAAAQPLPHDLAQVIRSSVEQAPFDAGLWRRLTASQSGCATARAAVEVRQWRGQEDGAQVQKIVELLERKETLLRKVRRHLQLKAQLEIWLYIHIPATFALLAALTAHIVSVFFYW